MSQPVMNESDNETATPHDNDPDDFEEITLEDVADEPVHVDPLSFIPEKLHAAARKLPTGKEYTLLDLAPPGHGHNASLLRVAATCYKMGVSYDDTLEHLQSCYSPDRVDYETAPRRACQRIWQVSGDISQITSDDSTAAPELRDEMLLRFRRLPSHKLIDDSPGQLNIPTVEILHHLFDGDDIINIQHTALEYGTLVHAKNIEKFLTKNKTSIDDWNFLNPATFKHLKGCENPLHPERKVSTRCNENVKKRRYMVLEFDYQSDDPNGEANAERFNMFALTMAMFAPLTMAVDTGNKSVHYWFDAQECTPKIRTAFFNLACLHGADPRLAVKSQIARMPNVSAEKDGRGKQSLLYFDPDGEKYPDAWDAKGFENHIRQNKQLDFYYAPLGGYAYLTRDTSERWIAMNKASMRVALAERGIRIQAMEGEQVAPADSVIHEIEMTRGVEAVLSGASGRHSGYYEENGSRAIVKNSPTFIKPRKGKFETITKFLTGMLGRDKDQIDVFLGWLSMSIRHLRNGGRRIAIFSPAQMLHIIGEPNAGKTLLLKDILTPCFGGRNACADSLFKKFASDFNSEMFGSELLFLDDSPVLETNYQFRVDFGERIKSHVVGVGGAYHQKRVDKVNMRPWWRFIRLMNTEPATLATLPPLDDGVEDKLIFLKAWSMKEGPLGKEMMIPKWYDRIAARIANEIPAFIHYLLEEYRLPKHLHDGEQRYPVMSYKNREIIEELTDQSAESYLLHLLDGHAKEMIFGGDFDDLPDDGKPPELIEWKGTCDDLFDALAQCGARPVQQRFQKVCPSPRVLLSLLRSLEKTNPHRVLYSTRSADYPDKYKGVKYWVIFPPGFHAERSSKFLDAETMSLL